MELGLQNEAREPGGSLVKMRPTLCSHISNYYYARKKGKAIPLSGSEGP
jgi:hypothetical protein